MLTSLWFRTSLLFLVISACKPITQEPIERWQQAIDGAYAGQISSDTHYSVVSSIDHGLSVWDLETQQRLYNWSHQQNSSDNLVHHIDISDNASHVITADKKNFSLWSLESGESKGYWKVSESQIRDITVSDQGKHLLIGKSNAVVVHFTVNTGRRLEFLGHKEKINSVDILPNGKVAMSGGNDFVAYIWDTRSGQKIYQFNHPSRVSKVALDPKGRFAFSADSMKSAFLWDLPSGKLISQLQGIKRQELFTTVHFSADGKTLITGAASRKVSVWDITTGKRLAHWYVSPKETKRPTGAVVYSIAISNNMTLMTISSSGYLESWPMPTSP